MLLNNKDLKLALKYAREYCPEEEIGNLLSRDNIMLIDIFYGNNGIVKILKKSLKLMESWNDEVGQDVKITFNKYINLTKVTIN
jgi:hypothetical protein